MLTCHNRSLFLVIWPDAKPGTRLMSGLEFPSSICRQHTAQLLERRAHLRFDRAYGAAPQLRDLLIRQSAVLPQEKNGLLFRTQLQEGDAEPLQGFFVRELVDRRRLDRRFW